MKKNKQVSQTFFFWQRSNHSMTRIFILFSILLIVVAISLTVFVSQYQAQCRGASLNLPDTSENIHIGLPFNYAVTNFQDEAGKIDYVFGSQFPKQPPSVYNTYYEHFDTEQNDDDGAYSLSWYQQHHSDWIEYRCDKKTPAEEFVSDGYHNAPLDITNPAVLDFLWHRYAFPELKKGYQGIAFDNVNTDNQVGQRCGHFDKFGNWVQQFSGLNGDSLYQQAVLHWGQNMYQRVHSAYPKATVSWNFSIDFNTHYTPLSLDYQLFCYVDILLDERGFTNYGKSNNYVTDTNWSIDMQVLQYLQTLNKGLVLMGDEPEMFANISRQEIQWILANYLLVKSNHTYMYATGNQEYGHMYIRPEYSAPIGHATTAMYQSQGVYMRDYSNGKAIVNPSSSQAFSVTLPANTYKNIYRNDLNSVSLGAHSAIVLLGAPFSLNLNPTLTPPLMSQSANQALVKSREETTRPGNE